MTVTRKSLADTIDGYDDEIAALQESKRETFQSYREDLAEHGIDKDGIRAEVEAVKKAIKRRRLVAEKSAEAVENADALADEIFAEISPSRAPRATRTRETADETQAQGNSAPAREPVKPEADASGEPAGGDHESVTVDQLTQETARPDDEADIIDFETANGELTPRALGSDVEPVAPDPRAFIKQLRPHCLNPDACGGQGRNHCFSCSVKIKDDPAESEAA